jgi:hypothetical protein
MSLRRLAQVKRDAQRVLAVHRPIVIDAVRKRSAEMLERARVGNCRRRHHERQDDQNHTCDPNLHTSLPKSRPGAP